MLIIFKLLAPFAILCGCILSLPMYASYVLTLDVAAKDIVIVQKNNQLGIDAEVIMSKGKGKFSKPIKGKIRRRK